MLNDDFSEENSHAENVKISIDRIIGQQTNTKRVKKTEEDRRKASFCRIIDKLIYTEERQLLLMEAHNIDLTQYNNIFYDVIDELFGMLFSKEQLNIINFYLYDRYTVTGQKLNLLDKEGNPIKIETSSDLWEVIKNIK